MDMGDLILNTGGRIPAFGLGTWQSKPGEIGAAVVVALKAGYRHIDCAHIYGNEAEIGESLQKCFREGVVKREEVFITSKLWHADHAPEDVEPACRLTLKNLQLEYLDLYLVHSPSTLAKGTTSLTEENKLGYDSSRMSETWKAMEGLVGKGLVKAIGISNFTITKTENLLKTAKIVPAVNQVESHPYFQQPKLKEYCDSKGIIMEVYAPLGSPATRGKKQDSDPVPLEDPVIKEIASKYNATVGQICIAFQLHRGLVVFPKSVTPDRIRENLKATEVRLDTEDLQRLRALDKNMRFFNGTLFEKKSATLEEIWDTVNDSNVVLPSMKAAAWKVKMNTGVNIPALGLGTWQSKPGEVGAAVEVALKAGYRHIDCAHIYGNEAEIGATLQKCFREGVVKREEVFITSKLWNADHAPEDVEPACRLTLKNLQLEYLDLYLVHSPSTLAKGSTSLTEDNKLGYDPSRMSETWKAMEGLVGKGLVKAIGISNFTITKTENLLKTAKIVPAVNQVESHPYFQQPKLKEYCDSKGIIFEVYAPLGSPGRVRKQDSDPDPLEDPVIKEIASKHGTSVGQICIAFQLHRGLVVIPKSVTPDRIRENLKATEVRLDTEDLQRLGTLDKNLRFFTGTFFVKKSATVEEIWDTVADSNFVLPSQKAV